MLEVRENYEITPMTLAIQPAYHEKYQSKILDLHGEFYSTELPIKIIERACLEGGSSLEGRKRSLQHKKSFFQCPPIPINPLEYIYAFPTCSPESYDCIWLFYEHIHHYYPTQVATLKWHEVIWNTVRIFSNPSTLMCTDWIDGAPLKAI